LAKQEPRSIGFVGCGVQSRFLLQAHRVLFRDLEVRAFDISTEVSARFAAEAGGLAVSAQQAAACDIVCTATPSRTPIIERSWIVRGAHINALGADAPGKQELDPRILPDAKVVIDDWEQAIESGEVNVALHSGDYKREQIHGTLGEVVAGKKAAREGDEITIFDSTGLALQDLALARHVYERAGERGLGTAMEIIQESPR
jgi:alanine dehydrogenase